jgi:hypothetical protein
MYLKYSEGANEVDIPEKLKNLIPKNYCIEAVKLPDGTETVVFSLIKIRSVTCKLTDIDLSLPDEILKSRIIEPMLNNLNRA